MIHAENETVRSLLFQGNFGLERETLRITEDGFLAQSPNPFPNNPHIVRDFSENQVEINTGVQHSPAKALAELAHYDKMVQTKLAQQNPKEMLWPFSNPPYLRDENDIPIAQFYGEEASKTSYREYLSNQYGRYKMTFSGIHFNYSFCDELLKCDFELSDFKLGEFAASNGSEDCEREEHGEDTNAGSTPAADANNAHENAAFTAYKNDLYLTLAQRCVAYGWVMSAITAASPIMDSSFVEQGNTGGDLYFGLGTVRCSELGYWNYFSPVLDYSSPAGYADSIQQYVDRGYIMYPSELYYPIRLKPSGAYSLDSLRAGNISHIELRMFDLNPTDSLGLNEQDVFFSQLLLIWLACTPAQPFTRADQIQAIQNFKNAAHYDLRTVKIIFPGGRTCTVNAAALEVLDDMIAFFRSIDAGQEVFNCLTFQRGKFTDAIHERYTHTVRHAYGTEFVKNGLKLAQLRQQEALARPDAFAEEV